MPRVVRWYHCPGTSRGSRAGASVSLPEGESPAEREGPVRIGLCGLVLAVSRTVAGQSPYGGSGLVGGGRRVVEGDVKCGPFDVGVEGAGGVGGEVTFEGSTAGLHPSFSDGAELGAAGGEGVQLVGRIGADCQLGLNVQLLTPTHPV